MLHRLLSDWRLIALTSALAVSLGSPWGAAARADSPQVTVVSPGGAARGISLEALAGSEDVVEQAYAVRSSSGVVKSRTVSGFSLGELLEASGADPFGFSYLEVQRPAGGAPVLLSRAQALDAGAFADGPPVVFAPTGGTGFLRPSAGDDDANAADLVEAPQGLTIVLRKGAALRVRASASPRRTEPGQKVSFAAVVEQSGAGEALTYSWYFDDGNSAEGPQPVHSFAKPGSYDVVVGVRAPGEETGSSAVVTIQVGAPSPGPDRKGGGTNKDASAPDHGAATSSAHAASPGDGPWVPPASSAAPGCSLCRPGRHKEQRSAGRPEVRRPEVRKRVERRKRTEVEPAGERVRGELIATAGTAAPEVVRTQRATAAARTGDPLGGSGGGGVPAAVWGGLATLGLLGAGALLEARGALALRGAAPGARGGRIGRLLRPWREAR